MLMAISPTNIQILFTNYDIITNFLNLASCSEHFISIKHRILATFNINKKNQSEGLYAFKSKMLVNKSSKKLHEDININSNNSTIKGENFMKIS